MDEAIHLVAESGSFAMVILCIVPAIAVAVALAVALAVVLVIVSALRPDSPLCPDYVQIFQRQAHALRYENAAASRLTSPI
jgi:Na+(H+)/acetate symporter ActP